MSGIVDAYGRPLQKEEAVEAARRGLALPAYALFGGATDEFATFNSFLPSSVSTSEGTSKFGAGTEEIASNWISGGQPNSPYSNLNPRFAHKNPIAQLNTPRDTQGIMSISMQYGQENYIVSRAIRVKRNFALRDMQFLGSATTREFYASEMRRLRVRSLLSQMFRYYWTTGRVCVYWGDERPVKSLTILDPRSLIVRRILGNNKVFMLPDPRWASILQRSKETEMNAAEATFLKKNLPRYWLKYIQDNQPIPLKDDSYALIENDLELFSLRNIDAPSNVPLQPIFQNLATLEMLMAGDFSVAWMLKHMIALVSIGDPKAEGANYKPPDQNDLENLRATFQRPDYSIWAFVDPTVDVRWIAPDPKLFNSDKFKYHVEAVEWCMGVPAVFSRSDGTFASSALSMKPFREEIEYARADCEDQFFRKLFPILREGVLSKVCGKKDPTVSWDVDCLKDDRVILAELTGRYDRGALSVQSLINGKTESFPVEVQRKLEELKLMQQHEGVFDPAYDASHGIPDPGGDEGGRPITSDTPSAEKSLGVQQPRPGRAT